MTLTSCLLRGLGLLAVATLAVFVIGIVAALLGTPKPLADVIAVGVGAVILLAAFHSLNR